jgi:hypothetical protein
MYINFINIMFMWLFMLYNSMVNIMKVLFIY